MVLIVDLNKKEEEDDNNNNNDEIKWLQNGNRKSWNDLRSVLLWSLN